MPLLKNLLARRTTPQNPATEQKASKAKSLITLHSAGQPQWTPRNYASFAEEGVAQNAICYRCVRMIAEAAASLPLRVWEGEVSFDDHPILTLLANPNARQCGAGPA